MLKIDKNICIGCGLCVGLCPENFQMEDDGKAGVTNIEVRDCTQGTIDNCPVDAISL